MANPGQDFGYLVLFDPYGNEVSATPEDLLSIEAKSFDKDTHLRAVNHQSGQYWLISDRPGFFPALVRITIFRCYPRTPENVEWSICYSEDGEASYPEFDLEWVIAGLSGSTGQLEWVDNPRAVPENVAAIARERVRYRLGHSTDEASRFNIRLHDAVTMRTSLVQYLEGTADLSEIVRGSAQASWNAHRAIQATDGRRVRETSPSHPRSLAGVSFCLAFLLFYFSATMLL